MGHPLSEIAPRIFAGYKQLIDDALRPFPPFGGTVADETGFETLSESDIELNELRERLTRGGLAPEAVEKAVDAWDAGDIFALNFAIAKGGFLICPVPEELLRKVFPIPDPTPEEEDLESIYLEYEINRHRFGKKSLTLRWPGDKDANGEEVAAASPAPEPTEKSRDPRKEPNADEDPWPDDDISPEDGEGVTES